MATLRPCWPAPSSDSRGSRDTSCWRSSGEDELAATVIDGNALAKELRATIDHELRVLRMSEVRCGLATVMVGEDDGALAYERHVQRLAAGLDYHYVNEHLPPDVELADVLATIGKLNADPRVTGILVLRP